MTPWSAVRVAIFDLVFKKDKIIVNLAMKL